MTTATTLQSLAERFGKEHAAAFIAEFGEPINLETAGDWDAVSLGEAHRLAEHEAGEDLEWSEFRLAYLRTLYGSDDVS